PGSRPKIDEAGTGSEGDPVGSRVQVSSDVARNWAGDSAGGGRGVVPLVEQLGAKRAQMPPEKERVEGAERTRTELIEL
ncbi:hypothetical protein KM043_000095, partial [Ampulex compressa]